jgi:hypothetical protein
MVGPNTVETCIPTPASRLHEAIDRLLNLAFRQGMGAVATVIARQAGGRPMRVKGKVGVPVAPDTVKLLDGDRTMPLMASVTRRKMRNHRIVAVTEVAASEHGRSMDGHGLNDDHRRATPGALLVIRRVATGRPPPPCWPYGAPKTTRLRSVLLRRVSGRMI